MALFELGSAHMMRVIKSNSQSFRNTYCKGIVGVRVRQRDKCSEYQLECGCEEKRKRNGRERIK